MVSSRLRNTIVFFALCGLLAGSAFAGTLTPATPTQYAFEIAKSTTALTLPSQVYAMGINRNAGQQFTIRFTLNQGTFAATPALAFAPAASTTGAAIIALRAGGLDSTFVEYDVNITANTAAGDTFTLTAPTYKFPAGAGLDSATTLTAALRDVMGDIDTSGTNARTIAVIKAAASFATASEINATIDATAVPPLTKFVANSVSNPNGDAESYATASLTLNPTIDPVKGIDGVTNYTLVAGDKVTITINGNFTGIDTVVLDLGGEGAANVGTASNSTATNEVFTINSAKTSATLTIDGNRFSGTRIVYFNKVAAAALDPRTFGVSASIAPAAGAAATRTLTTGNTTWYTWVQNGTTLLAPYVSLVPGNNTKFRFTNSSDVDVTILVALKLDQGTFTQNISSIVVPAGGSKQVTLTDAFAAGTNEEGPIATLLTGTQPVRAKATFTALSASPSVSGSVLIYSPVGVITYYQMIQR